MLGAVAFKAESVTAAADCPPWPPVGDVGEAGMSAHAMTRPQVAIAVAAKIFLTIKHSGWLVRVFPQVF
jgi:hypothetical protein